MKNKCSCIILNYNDADTTISLIRRIINYHNVNKIIVVDNCSTDDSFLRLSQIKEEKLIVLKSKVNGGYGAGNNLGVRYAYYNLNEKYALIANPDVYFTEQLIDDLLNSFSINKNIAVSTAIQKNIEGHVIDDIAWEIPSINEYIFMDTRIYHKLNKKYDAKLLLSQNKKYQYVECVPGAMLMVDTNKFIECGGYDENMFLYCEETLLGIKMKQAGYLTILLCNKAYDHMHSVSVNKTIKSKIEQYKLVVKNRIYLIDKYLNATRVQVLIARALYSFIIIKKKIKNKIYEET